MGLPEMAGPFFWRDVKCRAVMLCRLNIGDSSLQNDTVTQLSVVSCQ